MTESDDAMPVTTDDIQRLVDRAEAAGQLPLAGILLALGGAMHLRRERELMNFLTPFSEDGFRRATEGPPTRN